MAIFLTFEAKKYSKTIEEINTQSDRGAAIIAASLLESLLEELILQEFRQRDSCVEGRLFKGSGPLATFSAKIDLGFSLGFFSDKGREGLRAITKIRNQFAHRLDGLTFESNEISILCNKLPRINAYTSKWKRNLDLTKNKDVIIFSEFMAENITSFGENNRNIFMSFIQDRIIQFALLKASDFRYPKKIRNIYQKNKR